MDPKNELTQIARKYTQGRMDNGSDYFSRSMLVATQRRYNFWIFLFSDYDLNTVCQDICHEETYKCLMICDPTDSACISECFRVDATCSESKHLDINVTLYSLYYYNRLYYKGHICVVHNCIKVAPATSIVPMVVRTAKTRFANAR